MTTQGKFTLTGLEKYLESLARVSDNLNSDMQSVLQEAGAEVVLEMQSLVPVDTGNLRNHIQVLGPYQNGNFSFVEVGVIHDRQHTDKDTAIYGNVVEYGSAKMAARPYIRPALAAKKRVVAKILRETLQRYGLK